jgi:hypothetical protein
MKKTTANGIINSLRSLLLFNTDNFRIFYLIDKKCSIRLLPDNLEEVQQSVIAKSTGKQEEEDIAPQDAALFRHVVTVKKISKEEVNYENQEGRPQDGQFCIKPKFNLPGEKKCHIVDGEIDNGMVSRDSFSFKGDGMLARGILWDFIEKRENLEYEEGYGIPTGAEGFQRKVCNHNEDKEW